MPPVQHEASVCLTLYLLFSTLAFASLLVLALLILFSPILVLFCPFSFSSPSFQVRELELLLASPATRTGSLHLLFHTMFSLGNSEMESNKEKDRRVGRGTTTAKSLGNCWGQASEWKSLGNIINFFSSILITGVLQQASSCLEFPSVLRRCMAHMKPWMRKSLVTCEVSYQWALAATPTSPMLLRACSLTITKTSSPVPHFLLQRNSSLEA